MSKNLKKIMGLLVVSILALGFKANVYADCSNEAEYNDSLCSTLSEALSNVTTGKTIKLQKDVTVSEALTFNAAEKSITLDLNGHSINASGSITKVLGIENGNITITNTGEAEKGVISTESLESTTGGTIYVYENGHLTVDSNVTIRGYNPILASVKSSGTANNGEITIKSGAKLINNKKYGNITAAALTVHGYVSSASSLKITIEQDAELSSTVTCGAGIFQSGYAETTIQGKASGKTGIVIKSGKLNINEHAEITADGDYANAVPIESGFNGTGAAIQIESLNNDIEVNITAGKVTSASNSAILEYTNGSDTKVKKLEVNSSTNFSVPADKDIVDVSKKLEDNLQNSSAENNVEHKITIPTEVSHGKVELEEGKNKDKLLFGEFVTLKVTPDAGYHLGTFKITSDAKPVSVVASIASNDIPYTSVSGGYKFRMPNGDVNVEATFVKNSSSSSGNYHLKINIKIKDELIENYVINNGETLNDILNELKTKYSNIVGFTDSDNNKLELDTVAYDGMYLIAVLEDETISESPKTFDAISTIIAISVVSLGAIGFASKKYIKFN